MRTFNEESFPTKLNLNLQLTQLNRLSDFNISSTQVDETVAVNIHRHHVRQQ